MGAHAGQGWLEATFTPARRRWIYGTSAAAGPLLTVYGVLSTDELAVWLGFLGAALGLGAPALAAANTPPAHGRGK